MAAHRAELAAVLDEAEDTRVEDVQAEAGAVNEAAFAEEHLRRLKAEADAQDRAQRLQIAQVQLAEYASEKSAAASAALQQAEALEGAVMAALQQQAAAGGDAAAAANAAAASMQQLKTRLAEAALEAAAFAEQQQADVDRLKRSSAQAELMDVDGAVEHKRQARNTADGGSGDEDEEEQEQEQEEQEATTSTSSSSSDEDEAAAGGNDEASTSSSDDDDEQQQAAAAASGQPGSSSRRKQKQKLKQAKKGGGGGGAGGDAAAAAAAAAPSPRSLAPKSSASFRERCRFIPLRLRLEERRLLRLLEAALNVSEYTDKVDILAWRSKTSRVHAQLRDFCAILSGLVVAQDYKRGQALVAERDFDANAGFFQDVFEIGRRYKVMNPEKMRSEFGKLVYMLMDSADSGVQELLGFSCVRPLRTVAALLEEGGAGRLLDDPLLEVATAEIVAAGRPRLQVQRDIKAKERAREGLARKYRQPALSEEALLWAIYSISDNNAFLLFNRDPIDRMLALFRAAFRPDAYEAGACLAITGGRGGARLTHSHERQYHYVLQSLLLWREVMSDMFKLWYLAESDMLRPGSSYRLCDTGQGLNRVQAAPGLGRAMQAILGRCQSALGSWVGSSVVHLGDHNVPNALFFLNKYTQVPQILNPVVLVIEELPRLAKGDPDLASYIHSTFGGVAAAQRSILVDFCRHAFDGSGADNFFDAGSCIDGRLTSAWHWCSQLHKKPYYPLFKLAGFNGFDGDWK